VARRFGAAPLLFPALLALTLGYEQFLASVVLRDYATPAAWPALVPASLARAIDAREPLFASGALREQLARLALESGDLSLAQQRIAALAPSPERDALEGRLAELRGDGVAAARAYLAAGDSEGVQRRATALAAAGHGAEALALERSLVARLQTDPGQVDALADAWLAIGGLEASQGSPQRSSEAFARAVALAPLSERYLLPAGTQALEAGDLNAAQRYFTQAREADPSAAEAYAGLGEVALHRGDVAGARDELERAERLGPQVPSVRKLAHDLGR